MNFFLLWAFRNLFRHKRRNITTALTVAAGLAGLLLLWSYIYRTERYLVITTAFINRNGHLTITEPEGLEKALRNPDKYAITSDEQKKIEAVLRDQSGVEHFSPVIIGVGLVGNGCKSFPTYIRATDPATESYIYNHPEVQGWSSELADIKKGRWFFQDGAEANNEVDLSMGLGYLLKKDKTFTSGPTQMPDCKDPKTIEADNNVQISGLSYQKDFAAVDANVAGLFTTGFHLLESSYVQIPLKKAQELFATDKVGRYIVFLKDPGQLKREKAGLEKRLRENGLKLEVNSFDHPEIGLFYTGTMHFLYTMAGFFLFLILIVIAFAIGNQLTLSIVERSREIGTLRAMGFRQIVVNRLLVVETLIVSMCGGLFGVGFSYAIIFAVNHMNLYFHPPGVAGMMTFKLYAPFQHAMGLFLVMSFLCYLGTLVIVRYKARQTVVQLLTATVT